MTNSALTQYQSQLTELRQQRAQLATAFTTAYPKVKRLQAEIAELEKAIERDRSNIINRVRTETQAAVQRETLLQNAYDRQVTEVSAEAGRVMNYTILKQEVDSNRRLYEDMLKNMNEAGVSAAMQPNNVRIVDAASPPAQPFRPRTVVNVAAGLMTGLVFACLAVLLREAVDHSINRPGDARSFLNIPELGAIPFFKAQPISGSNLRRLSPGSGNGDRRHAEWNWRCVIKNPRRSRNRFEPRSPPSFFSMRRGKGRKSFPWRVPDARKVRPTS